MTFKDMEDIKKKKKREDLINGEAEKVAIEK